MYSFTQDTSTYKFTGLVALSRRFFQAVSLVILSHQALTHRAPVCVPVPTMYSESVVVLHVTF